MLTVAIHQPEYWPWLGLLAKVQRVDVLVLLDSVQFNRESFQHRARIADAAGKLRWLTMPYRHAFPLRIDEVALASSTWGRSHADSIRSCYLRAPAYREAAQHLDDFFTAPWLHMVADVADRSMATLAHAVGIAMPQVVRSATLGVTGTKSELVLGICKHLGATRYLSGATGALYLDHEAFSRAGVEIEVQRFSVPRYRDGQPDVVLSALDAWLWLGPDKTKELLRCAS